ncbi:ankyrin repeat-containing protein BDA1-like [Nicotiana sylvestris]|uniref:Ankyrin-2-like n=1 Tax=Nicotiana sylvestris TaxID=4096 RepID=A0A1U7XDU8_NICSY|nr:PREDICTED: ankyrin-2-like [Nicotiana sylvestris]
MELELKRTAETGDINAFYGVVERKPGILKAIEAKDFAETPLHVAASAGNTELAIEILSLKPSFGRKLNPSGYSPLDMALRYGQQETVKQLIKFDPELIGLRSRERKTPLHYAAETDDADLVAEFLVACPTAVKQLTVRGETAVHLAVLKGSTNAFNVLMGWIIRTDNTGILGWKDNRGNTVLHIAAQTGQVEVIERLIKEKVNLHGRNQANQTALDVVSSAEIQNLLRRAGALRSSELLDDLMYKDFLTTHKYKQCRQAARTQVDLDKGIADGARNSFLVATVLIATATFQAVLSPPGGGWLSKEDDTNYINSNPTLPAPPPPPVELYDDVNFEIDMFNFYKFIFLNSITFGSSLGMTFLLMPLSVKVVVRNVCIGGK